MLEALITALQNSAKPVTFGQKNEYELFSRQVHLPPREPMPEALQLNSLNGLIDFVANFQNNHPENMFYLHVVDHATVQMVGDLEGRHQQRPIYAEATTQIFQKSFATRALPVNEFIIELLAKCVQSDEQAELLETVGNMRSEEIRTSADDGVSQNVSTRKGVTGGRETVKKFWDLQPYSTFREIDQPARRFLLRLSEGRDGHQVALYEADAGSWKLDAIAGIKAYLETQLNERNVDFTLLA